MLIHSHPLRFSRICALLALLLYCATSAYAQVANHELFPHRKSGQSVRPSDINNLIRKGKSLFAGNKGDSAVQTILLALQYSSSSQYRPGMDSSLRLLRRYLNELDRIIYNSRHAEIVQKAIDYSYAVTNKDNMLAVLHNDLGGYFLARGQYAQSLLEFERALKAIPDDNSPATISTKVTTYTNISGIWATLNEKEEAFNALDIAEQIAAGKEDPHKQVALLQNRGILYFNSGELDSALHFLQASLDLSLQHEGKDPQECQCRQFTVANLALTLLQRHEPERALKLVNQEILRLEQLQAAKAKKGFFAERTSDLMAFYIYLQGYAYYEQREYAKSRSILVPLLALVQKEGVNQVEANIHEILSAQYDSTGDYQKAYEHKSSYTLLVTDREKWKEKSKLLALRYSIEKMEALTQKQLLIGRQSAALKEKNIWIGAVSCGTLLLATSLFAFYRSNKSRQRLQNSSILNLRQEKEISQLQAKVEGEEQERSRIAHELHDGIVSQLLSLKLNVNALQMNPEGPIQPYQLNEVAIQLEEATQDLRRTAHNLMPNLLLQQGLALSVAALCEKINRNTPLEADFQAYGNLPRLPQDTELALYRMVQELVQNVLKHAEATQLLVQLSSRDNLLSITVEDNGKGIPISQLITVEKSSGLAHIRKKTELMGGQIDIKSKQGKQTTIYLEFDLTHMHS